MQARLRATGGRVETLAVGGWDSGRHVAQGRIERARGGIVHDLARDPGRHALHDHPWLHDAAAHTVAHQRDRLVHIRAGRVQARYPVLVVTCRSEGQEFGDLLRRLHAVPLRDREVLRAPFI
jgi:hypothetical protein